MIKIRKVCYHREMNKRKPKPKNNPVKLTLVGQEKVTSNYRDIAARGLEKQCADCHITDLVVVHHKHGREAGDELWNLEWVCHNHHGIRHMKKTGRGKWEYDSHVRTPRDKLPFLRKKILGG
jgi:hypothetical protein